MKCAAVTMVYDDPEYLPIWCKYYGSEFGPENCFIIDHGSDDGSTRNLPFFNVLRIPRSPKDNEKRTRFLSKFCSNLLEWYSAVIHTDVDEIAVADPLTFKNLPEYMLSTTHKIVNAIGFDIYHMIAEEPNLDLRLPILKQRKWLRFSSSMCKPVLIKRPVLWSPGFHSADAPIVFDRLYLFHLRYFDLKIGLARLQRTRSMDWANPSAGSHQRVGDDTFTSWIEQASRKQRISAGTLLPSDAAIERHLQRVLQSEVDFQKNTYNLDLHIFGDEMIQIPIEFEAKF